MPVSIHSVRVSGGTTKEAVTGQNKNVAMHDTYNCCVKDSRAGHIQRIGFLLHYFIYRFSTLFRDTDYFILEIFSETRKSFKHQPTAQPSASFL